VTGIGCSKAEEKLLNAAIYTLPEISPDDPIEALKRLAKFKSENPFADIWALITSVGLLYGTGATRMSDDPKTGVVDANCKVHDVENLYVAGASVFPTSGHANPTLMITSLALRLADHLKVRMTTLPASVIAPRVPATSA
jgi:choline dehydrogenase-like flavoprotein